MSGFDQLNRSGLAMLADPEALIRERGGADSMYANDPAKLRACNRWVDHARPIIQAMFAVEDADAPLIAAVQTDDSRFARYAKRSPLVIDCDDARETIRLAGKALYGMLDGIRDNFLCDERCGIGNTDDETEAADEFNDWLDASTITVDQAVQIVIAEQNAAYVARRAA